MLVAAGLEADRVTINTLLKVCMRGNLPDKALHTFNQMQQLKIPVSSLELLAMPGVSLPPLHHPSQQGPIDYSNRRG